MFRYFRKGLLATFLTVLVLAAGFSDYRPTAFDLAVAPYQYSLVNWEVSHFMDKWLGKLGGLMPWNSQPSREQRIALAQEYFDLNPRLQELERRLVSPGDDSDSLSEDEARSVRSEIESIRDRRSSIQGEVEEIIESEISAVLAQEGFSSRIGLIFPPVDTVYARSPAVLILSPRDRIHRQTSRLLSPGINNQQRNELEELVLREENMSALVESTGGVATFPSVVSGSSSLHHAVVTTAHEWLHHWFFFQPLGQHFWDSSQMTTLNETAATLAGEVIGDRAFTAMTGEVVNRDPQPPSQDPSAFDFNAEMRETRLMTESLLAQGKIVEAEAYMEERRQFMVANGFFIRKINQAFFAFHGSYAASAASISPIDGQLEELRARSDSLEEFIKTIGRFASHREFLDFLDGTASIDSTSGGSTLVVPR